ncbi:pyruvate kinase [Heliobacillus mobilis]|uniref:Pyruvate kinase n=1 Tax=Heliobacterium mobile TaxID=28064 RepID=A0A6I3SHS9_HELMO|nr:pyruvate kinase [Heliobacterium mobile]MTV48424.1 pyruvate kinase [Heliobacterium mobile]
MSHRSYDDRDPLRVRLAEQLGTLYNVIIEQAQQGCSRFPYHALDAQYSCDNLLAYLSLRRHDIFDLQLALAEYGLSSLGRLEGSVLAALNGVLRHLGLIPSEDRLLKPDSIKARQLLAARSQRLLGRPRGHRATRIMVTLDSSCLRVHELLEELLLNGMDMARINCAHESPYEWKQIIQAIRKAEEHLEQRGEGTGRNCRIMMDLGGPKIRTGPLEKEICPLKLAVPRDLMGFPHRLLEGYLDAEAAQSHLIDDRGDNIRFVIALPNQPGIDRLRIGNKLSFMDTRERKRVLHVIERISPSRVRVGLERTAYVQEGILLNGDNGLTFVMGPVVPQPVRVEVTAGDILRLYSDPNRCGHPASTEKPAGISCTLPEALLYVEPDQRVFIDDGKIGAIVQRTFDDHLELKIFSPEHRRGRIKSEKGLNFPDSLLELPALTEQDRQDLNFVIEHADAVGLSFVHRPKDLLDLKTALTELGRPDIGVIAKIETSEAIHRLAQLLLAGLDFPSFGIMIARGDLAVEVGFENLALVQEDILCLCEAAHIPVIWATQVLETLAKTGLPARAEITDAAMSHRADCVMLNKGPHILDAVKTLSTLLCAEERHQIKKRQIFREFTEQHGIFEEA